MPTACIYTTHTLSGEQIHSSSERRRGGGLRTPAHCIMPVFNTGVETARRTWRSTRQTPPSMTYCRSRHLKPSQNERARIHTCHSALNGRQNPPPLMKIRPSWRHHTFRTATVNAEKILSLFTVSLCSLSLTLCTSAEDIPLDLA